MLSIYRQPPWFIGTLGSILAACIPAGVYPTTMPDTCCYIASHSRAAVLLVDGKAQLMKYARIQSAQSAQPGDVTPTSPLALTENLKAIIVWNEPQTCIDTSVSAQFPVPVYLWSEFLDLGRQTPSLEEDVDRRLSYVLSGQCASLVYTSGTTGPPKSVMLSHDNITWTAKTFLSTCFHMTSDDRLVLLFS
jgi:long-chain-fatty-acid--CoA ligase ACSBG